MLDITITRPNSNPNSNANSNIRRTDQTHTGFVGRRTGPHCTPAGLRPARTLGRHPYACPDPNPSLALSTRFYGGTAGTLALNSTRTEALVGELAGLLDKPAVPEYAPPTQPYELRVLPP